MEKLQEVPAAVTLNLGGAPVNLSILSKIVFILETHGSLTITNCQIRENPGGALLPMGITIGQVIQAIGKAEAER